MIQKSNAYEDPAAANNDSGGVTSLSVTVPNANAAAGEEDKEMNESQTMDELLGAYENELDIDTDFDDMAASKMAQEVNLLKQASEQQMDVAMQREQSL